MRRALASRIGSAGTASIAIALLSACAGTGAQREAGLHPPVPPQWFAPLPPPTAVAASAPWWAGFDDPLLGRLVDAAEVASPTLASAQARIADARAARAGAAAALLPTVDATVNATRGRPDLSLPSGASQGAGVQAQWDLDAFGRNRAARDAAQARLDSRRAGWHDAHLVVATEAANTYVELRSCEARLAQARIDAASRAETSRLTDLSATAGFEAPANAALARASAAQGELVARQQGEQCERDVKALVALTAIAEPELRAALAAAAARVPQPGGLAVPGVPAEALAARPDVHAREQEVIAASADVDSARAAQWPRMTLAGSVGVGRLESSLGNFSGTTWSIGPIAVSVPVFDAGARRADVVAARARYDEAIGSYRATLRDAIRDVESALVSLQGTADRAAAARVAADNFEASVRATEARYRSGFGTLFELEDARRSALVAQNTLIDLQRERAQAWIALHRALGGGWSVADLERVATTATASKASP